MRKGGKEKEKMSEKNVLEWLFRDGDREGWYSLTHEQKSLVYRYTVLVYLFGVLGGMSGAAFLWA